MFRWKEVDETFRNNKDPSKLQEASKVSGWYSLPLEIRQMILLEALESSLSQKDPKKQLLCLLKSLAKTSYSFGQDELWPSMRAIGRHLEDILKIVARSSVKLKDITRRIIEEEDLPRGPRWDDLMLWPFCYLIDCPVCAPYRAVTKLFYDQIAAARTIHGCQAALSEAFWRLSQMRGHREWTKVIGAPVARRSNAGNTKYSTIEQDRAHNADDQEQQSGPTVKRDDRISEVRADFDRAAARLAML